MVSMTGYGFCEHNSDQFQVSVEIKSYNNRYLDLMISGPPAINPLEERIREEIRKSVLRGRVEVYLRFKDLSESVQVSLDRSNVGVYTETLKELAALAGLRDELRLEHLLGMEGLLRIDRRRDPESYWAALQPVLLKALEGLRVSRLREGQHIKADLEAQLAVLESSVDKIKIYVPAIEKTVKESLKARFEEVLGDQADEQRVLSEVAVQLVRLSINEEVVRLGAHLESAKKLLASGEALGKKLDFLCQEINREINTLGSKNILLEVSNLVILVKDALENMREQLRNVE